MVGLGEGQGLAACVSMSAAGVEASTGTTAPNRYDVLRNMCTTRRPTENAVIEKNLSTTLKTVYARL